MATDNDLQLNTKELKKLREILTRRGRLGRVFIHGLVQGIGTALGATIIAALAIAIFLQFLQATGIDRYLPQGVVKSWQIEV